MSDQQVYITDADRVHPPRSYFDLSHTTYGTYEMGRVYPILCKEMLPGDTFKVSNSIFMRLMPMVAPILDQLEIKCEYFYVPYRILWDQWEDFITGGKDGTFEAQLPLFVYGSELNRGVYYDISTKNYSKFSFRVAGGSSYDPNAVFASATYSLWDYFGFPVLSGSSASDAFDSQLTMLRSLITSDRAPVSFPWLAYTKIWNDWYRDEDLEDEIELFSSGVYSFFAYPFYRSWPKDYFTSARPWQQKGISPALPVTSVIDTSGWTYSSGIPGAGTINNEYGNGLGLALGSNPPGDFSGVKLAWSQVPVTSTTFDVSDLRLAFAVQKYLELNSRSGSSRYIEFLRAQYGVFPRDDRLQRPEYIGSTRQPFITSEVLQLSSTDATSPQGNMAGHGISADRNYVAKYTSLEHGLIMGLMTVMPKANYSQGIDRSWLRRSRYDFYHPLFANLSEQGIENVELYAQSLDLTGIFGFQGRWDEYRTARNNLVSQMRSVNGSDVLTYGQSLGVPSLSYWHFGRYFASEPALNSSFLFCIPRKDAFAVQDEPPIVAAIHHKIDAFRPLPAVNVPGLIDHM